MTSSAPSPPTQCRNQRKVLEAHSELVLKPLKPREAWESSFGGFSCDTWCLPRFSSLTNSLPHCHRPSVKEAGRVKRWSQHQKPLSWEPRPCGRPAEFLHNKLALQKQTEGYMNENFLTLNTSKCEFLEIHGDSDDDMAERLELPNLSLPRQDKCCYLGYWWNANSPLLPL